MKCVQGGKSPASIALSRSRPWLSRSLATRASASASVVRNALLCAEMELDPDPLIGGIYHREGVTAEAMHVTQGPRDATVGHHNGHLVQCFLQERPEVPVVVGRAQPGARIARDR